MTAKRQHSQPLDPGMLEERQRRVGILEGLVTQYENNGQTRKAVNNGLSRPTAATSAFRGKADANDAKADITGVRRSGGDPDTLSIAPA